MVIAREPDARARDCRHPSPARRALVLIQGRLRDDARGRIRLHGVDLAAWFKRQVIHTAARWAGDIHGRDSSGPSGQALAFASHSHMDRVPAATTIKIEAH